MTKMKYTILCRVYKASVQEPARRKDFYKYRGKINQYKRCIDELIQRKYLSEAGSSDILTITTTGIDTMEAEQERIRLFRWDFCRYAVTTIIALIALAVSIFSLMTR